MARILEDRHAFVSVTDLKTDMARRMKERKPRFSNLGSENPTIYRVPSNLRQGADGAYDPKLISIGPLHYGTSVELNRMQDLKWKYTQDLIEREPELNSLERFVEIIWREEERARRQYSVKIELEPSEFVELLVLDGCFLVEFLIKRAVGSVGYPWSAARWNLPMLRNDLLLIENQIPFFVLEIIYENSHVVFPNQVCLTLLDFALHYVSKNKLSAKDLESKLGEGTKVYHLLHLDYLCKMQYFAPVTPAGQNNPSFEKDQNNPSGKRGRSMMRKPSWMKIKRRLAYCFFFLLSWIVMCKRPWKMGRTRNKKAPRAIPTATKLKSAGVRFRIRKPEEKEKECLLNVSFSDKGRLEIPFISLQQNTASSFRNLIALEQCCKDVGLPQFTAYAIFMDKIIDTSDDVAILVREGIIESKLGTDDDVAFLFNNICKGASLNYDKHYLTDLFKRVNKYYISDENHWKAALLQDYFHNPWARVSFIFAIFLLGLTILGVGATIWQTIYTVRSDKN